MQAQSAKREHPSRIRGRKLQAIRARHFAKFPLCVDCEANGKVRLATELDHIQALTNGGQDTQDNRQGLCKPCHEAKTAKDMGYRQRGTTGPDGWPVGG
jgi:5-methylcytosine-specific restriction protein A